MMAGLKARAEAAGRAARERRLEQIARSIRARGLSAEITLGSVLCSGRKLVQAWLADPLLRFAGRMGA